MADDSVIRVFRLEAEIQKKEIEQAQRELRDYEREVRDAAKAHDFFNDATDGSIRSLADLERAMDRLDAESQDFLRPLIENLRTAQAEAKQTKESLSGVGDSPGRSRSAFEKADQESSQIRQFAGGFGDVGTGIRTFEGTSSFFGGGGSKAFLAVAEISESVEAIAQLRGSFKGLPQTIQATVSAIGGGSFAAGATLLGAFALIGGGISALVSSIKKDVEELEEGFRQADLDQEFERFLESASPEQLEAKLQELQDKQIDIFEDLQVRQDAVNARAEEARRQLSGEEGLGPQVGELFQSIGEVIGDATGLGGVLQTIEESMSDLSDEAKINEGQIARVTDALKSSNTERQRELQALSQQIDLERQLSQDIAGGLTTEQATERLRELQSQREAESNLLDKIKSQYPDANDEIKKSVDLIGKYDAQIKLLNDAIKSGTLAAEKATDAEEELSDSRSRSGSRSGRGPITQGTIRRRPGETFEQLQARLRREATARRRDRDGGSTGPGRDDNQRLIDDIRNTGQDLIEEFANFRREAAQEELNILREHELEKLELIEKNNLAQENAVFERDALRNEQIEKQEAFTLKQQERRNEEELRLFRQQTENRTIELQQQIDRETRLFQQQIRNIQQVDQAVARAFSNWVQLANSLGGAAGGQSVSGGQGTAILRSLVQQEMVNVIESTL